MIRLKSLGFVTQQEVAEMLGKQRQTVAVWHKNKELPKAILEQKGIIIWKLKDIENFMRRRLG